MNTEQAIRNPRRYGITERKKAELDMLANQVIDAQYDVEKLEAMAAALTQKATMFQAFLGAADTNKTKATSNSDLLDELIKNIHDLQMNSSDSFDKMVLADKKTKKVALGMKELIDKLVYSAELIDKLSNLVIRAKALNPLISDDLVAMIGQAGKDANNAVALTLVALQSIFAAQGSSLEAEAATALEYTQSRLLYETITGKDANGNQREEKNNKASLKTLVASNLVYATDAYTHAQKANIQAINELSAATAELSKAQINLRSLQSGLAAANAAALAS